MMEPHITQGLLEVPRNWCDVHADETTCLCDENFKAVAVIMDETLPASSMKGSHSLDEAINFWLGGVFLLLICLSGLLGMNICMVKCVILE